MFAGSNDYALTKLQTALAAGKAPDIAYQYGSSMALLAKLPQVVDLTSRVNDPAFDWNDFFPAVRLATTVNGKVLGVPALVDNLALVYNKKLFDQAGVPYPDGAVDLGRLPRRRPEADQPLDQAVRLGVRQRRQRGHRLALPRPALAGRRRPAHARQHEGRVQLARRA